MINAVRGHLAEFGLIARRGARNIRELADLVRDTESDVLPNVALTNRILGNSNVVSLSETDGGPVVRYTTRQVLASEAAALSAAAALHERQGFAMTEAWQTLC